jgi:hypothetical protein
LGYDQSEYFMKRFVLLILALTVGEICAASLPPIQTVFIIMFENRNWSSVLGNTNAPYINSLLPMASYCQQYYTPPGNHPSEANYLWLEAGTNFGIFNDNPPAVNSQNTTNHFTTLLNNAGISWKTYQEGINGVQLPLYIDPANSYDPKHNPFLFFDDVTGTNDPNNAYGMAHERPFTELADDLASNTVANYNFLVPNLCDDGHDCPLSQADWWLSQQVPMILASAAYANNGAIFICWDEGNNNGDGPLGMIVLSRLARGGGYHNNIYYTHSSTLLTFEEIFNVTPLLGGAANATDLSDLFGVAQQIGNLTTGGSGNSFTNFQFTVTGLLPGQTYEVQCSTDLVTWIPVSTNVCLGNSIIFNDTTVTSYSQRFYRLMQQQ